MNAREVLEGMIRTDRGDMTVHSPAEVQNRLDAYRTEALTEGAALLEDRACDADWDRPADYCQGLRAGAELLLAKTVEKASAPAATADFFRPGHTYANANGFRFACLAVAPTPWDGTLRAIGYLTRSDGSGCVHGLAPDQWTAGVWNDITDTTTGGPHV